MFSHNECFLLYGLIYSLFRVSHADPSLASDLTNLAVRIIGFFGCLLVPRRIVPLPSVPALAGATIVTIPQQPRQRRSRPALRHRLRALARLAHLVGCRGFRPACAGAFVVKGSAACLLYGAWLLSTFYIAWFSAFFCLFLRLPLWLREPISLVVTVAGHGRRMLPAIALVELVFVPCLLPAARVYVPTASETGMHPAAEVLSYSPSLLGILNVGPMSWFYGTADRLPSSRLGADFPAGGERVMGVPPILLCLALVGGVAGRRTGRIWRAFGLTTLLTWLFTVHVGGFSVWRLVYPLIPGAKAVRVISRYQLFLDPPLVILAMDGSMLVLEQLNAAWPLGLERPRELLELLRVAAVPPMPTGCVAFYATGERPGPIIADAATDAEYSNSVDATFIAEVRIWPTVNGMASFVPKGWDLGRPEAADYRRRVESHAVANAAGPLCDLDLSTLRWTQGPSREPTAP